jgi:hypothetical protein
MSNLYEDKPVKKMDRWIYPKTHTYALAWAHHIDIDLASNSPSAFTQIGLHVLNTIYHMASQLLDAIRFHLPTPFESNRNV